MQDKNVKKGIIAVVAPLTLALGLGVATVAHAGTYVTESGKGVVTNNYGECWKAKGGMNESIEACGDAVAKPEPAPAPVAAPVDGDADGDGVKDSKDECPNTRAGAKVNSVGCEIIADVSINLVEDEFDFDSAKLKPGMKTALDGVAAKVKATPGDEQLHIVGHTDSVGPAAYNMGLSLRRAQAAADYLTAQGVARGNITIEGKGETEPVASNKTKADRAKNRRVDIHTK